MTCYSWYIVAVPHLHHSLTIYNVPSLPKGKKYLWPETLRRSHELGLLPLVKRFQILPGVHDITEFTPEWLGKRTLCYFSALTNLQELIIDKLQISSFMPNIQQCFGHFSPTLLSLILKDPNGSCRQILYFIGLFPNLQNFELHYRLLTDEQESTADATLVPPSIPPLRGWLSFARFAGENFVKEMITLFGGLRFRHVDLYCVKCVRLILDACTETLETLRLYPSDPYGEEFLKRKEETDSNERFVVKELDSPRDFDLSRHKSLRRLETTAQSINIAGDTAPHSLGTVLSSVTSSALLDVVVIYRNIDLGGARSCWYCDLGGVCYRHSWWNEMAFDAECYQRQLRVFREMCSVRTFRLVLRVDVSNCAMKDAIRKLKRVVKWWQAEGGLDRLSCEPLIV